MVLGEGSMDLFTFQSEFKTNTPGPFRCLSPFRDLINSHSATGLFNDNEMWTFLNWELTMTVGPDLD